MLWQSMPSSVFPSFSGSAGRAAALGAISFHNQGQPQTARGLAGLDPELMGFVGGVPLLLLDEASGATLVLSPPLGSLNTIVGRGPRPPREGRGGLVKKKTFSKTHEMNTRFVLCI